MKSIARTIVAEMAAVAVLALVSPALAGPWSQPGGATDSFLYANGGDINGRFGEPFVALDTFYFFSTNFQVNSSNGSPAVDSKDDTMSVDVLAKPGLMFSEVHVMATGSYAVSGDASVDLDAELRMEELGGLGRTFFGPLVTDVAFPITSGNGTYNGNAVVDVTFVFPTPFNEINLQLENLVQALSSAGGASELNVQFQQMEISFTVIPEPATLGLLALGGLVGIRRRR